MELLIKTSDETVEIKTLFQKTEKLYKKLAKKTIQLYKREIYSARKLKQNGILLPLGKKDTGSIYTDEVHDTDSLQILAKTQNWSGKCLWIDLTNNRKYILYIEKEHIEKI